MNQSRLSSSYFCFQSPAIIERRDGFTPMTIKIFRLRFRQEYLIRQVLKKQMYSPEFRSYPGIPGELKWNTDCGMTLPEK